jgi:hypothetical protein
MGKTVDYFKPWMNDSITYKGKISSSGAQVIYASDGVELDCYIAGDNTLVINNKGEEVVSNEQIFLDGSDSNVAAIDFSGIIEINGRRRIIKAINKFKDEDGNLDLVVVYL